MFGIDDISIPIVGSILRKIFDKIMNFILPNRKEEKVIGVWKDRMNELERKNTELDGLLQKEKTEKSVILDALKRKAISIDKLIRDYDKPLNAILLSYSSQKERGEGGATKKASFLKGELMKYEPKYLGGTEVLIPPARVPAQIKTEDDLEEWFEKEILKNRFCKVKFLILLDLKKVFWKNYSPQGQKRYLHFSIGEKLLLEDVFTKQQIKAQINNISLNQIIKDGNIGWLASSCLCDRELEVILKHQVIIEKDLGNPSLRLLSDKTIIPKLSNVLSKFIDNPDEVAKKIVDEAIYWEDKLK